MRVVCKKYLCVASFALAFFSPLAFADSHSEAKTAAYFNSIRNNPDELAVFLQDMPKGGDLHNHLAGATYPIHLIDDGDKDAYCMDPQTFTILPHCRRADISIKQLPNDPELYEKTIKAWSMRGFVATPAETGEHHFFATFGKFFPLYAAHHDEALAEVMQRAAKQHEDYLELMINAFDLNMPATSDGDPSMTLGKQIPWKYASDADLAKMRAEYLAKGLPKIVQQTSQAITQMETQTRKQLKCGTDQADTACNLQVRYLYYALRDLPLPQFFAQILTGFELANRDSRVVGINIVRPEDNYLSTHQYTQEMQIIGYLHKVYPKVHITLHAGELSNQNTTPEDLSFHIRQAIEIAHAERIGHGVSITQEENSAQLLKEMATKPVPVEINLTSNATILGISGKDHPLPLYLENHVPVVLSTDDEAVLRTDLTREYLRAVTSYQLDYQTIKNFARNAITYSFLPGKSMWQNAANAEPVDSCKSGLTTPSCEAFLKTSEKARMQAKLESQFDDFERKF